MKNLSSKVMLSKFDLDVITSLLTSEDGNPAFNKLAAEMEPDETKRQLLLLHFGIVLHSNPVDASSIEPRYEFATWRYRQDKSYIMYTPFHIDRIHSLVHAHVTFLNINGEVVNKASDEVFEFAAWDHKRDHEELDKAIKEFEDRLTKEADKK